MLSVSFKTLQGRDPSQTAGLRRSFSADATRRYRLLRSAIWQSVAVNDCFGLREKPTGRTLLLLQSTPLPPIPTRAFEYERSDQKIIQFMDWLNEQESKSTLEIIIDPTLPRGERLWSDVYVHSSYQKGIADSRRELIKAGVEVPSFDAIGQSLAVSMNQPIHADRLGLIYTRVFESLKGVDREMDKQISRVLARGLAEGRNPNQIARQMTDRVDKIGITRTRLIARTEVVQTFNEATLNEFDVQSAVIEEPIYSIWQTAGDARVRDEHAVLDQQVLTREEAEPLLGDPNCRCALLPYIESIHGKADVVGRDVPPPTPLPSGIRESRPLDQPMGVIGGMSGCVSGVVANIVNVPRSCSDYVRSGDKWLLGNEFVAKEVAERLDKMRIPPAWEDVVVATDRTAKVQAIGRDVAGRWQYRYSAEHIASSKRKKFNRVKSFSRDVPTISRAIADGVSAGDARAYALLLEEQTAIRAGSVAETGARKKAYGLTTLRGRHVHVDGDFITLEFTAKKGKLVKYKLEDKTLAKWLKQRRASLTNRMDDMVFYDASANRVNAYLRRIAGGKKYTIKDYRTYHGTRIAYEELKGLSGKTLTVAERKKVVKDVSVKVSEFLRNTPAMARSAYIDPMVWDLIGGLP